MERIINLDDSIQMPTKTFKDKTNRAPIFAEKKIDGSNKTRINDPILLSSFAVESESAPISKNIKKTKTEIVIPNVRGMSLKKAINTLQNSGLESKFAGSGTVVWQSPKPGTVSMIGTICSIGLE
jgi:beta-lactam-binding protein with PASTA domain